MGADRGRGGVRGRLRVTAAAMEFSEKYTQTLIQINM